MSRRIERNNLFVKEMSVSGRSVFYTAMLFVFAMFFVGFLIESAILITSPHYQAVSITERGTNKMITYKKLWKVLIDKDLKKKDLITIAGVSSYTVNKLTHGDNVTTDVLQRICKALECDIGDIMEVLPDEPETNNGSKER